MKNLLKKLTAITSMTVILFSCFVPSAFAEQECDYYNVSRGKATITEDSGGSSVVTIKAKLGAYSKTGVKGKKSYYRRVSIPGSALVFDKLVQPSAIRKEETDTTRYTVDATNRVMPKAGANGFIAPITPRDPDARPISTVAQLRAMQDGGNYYLTKDIDLSSYNGGVWKPLSVTVKLDGQGHKLFNLNIPLTANLQYAGLFGIISTTYNELSVKNLGVIIRTGGVVSATTVNGRTYENYATDAGGIVGCIYNCTLTISNCYVTGALSCRATGIDNDVSVGGLVGDVNGGTPVSISDCYTIGSVETIDDSDFSVAGGLIGTLGTGESDASIVNCYSLVTVSSWSGKVVSFGIDLGGLVGLIFNGTISNCYATGMVNANASDVSIGGLVGMAYDTTFTNCFTSGKVNAITPASGKRGDIDAGGLVGYAGCPVSPISVTGCYASGAVNIAAISNNAADGTTHAYAGGLIGRQGTSSISNSYALGAVTAKATSIQYTFAAAGGLTGSMYDTGKITSCYAIGAVHATSNSDLDVMGGLVGKAEDGTVIVESSYFDKQTAGISQAIGNNDTLLPNAGKTTLEVKNPATYTKWKLSSVWGIFGERNNGYPYLLWQYSPCVLSSAASAGFNSIKLMWTSIPYAFGYEVYRATTRNGTYSKMCTTSGTAFTDTGLTAGISYYYKVRAYFMMGSVKICDLFSEIKAASPVPVAPASLKAASVSYNSVRLTWDKVSGASGYEIYRATSSTGTYAKAATITSGSTLTYTNTGLATGTTYYYKVRAYTLVGTTKVPGSYSIVASAKPIPSAPTGITAARTSSTSNKISWSAVNGASGYYVYRATSSSGTYTAIKATSNRAFTDAGLTTGRVYYYKIQAYRLVGAAKVFGVYSVVASAKP